MLRRRAYRSTVRQAGFDDLTDDVGSVPIVPPLQLQVEADPVPVELLEPGYVLSPPLQPGFCLTPSSNHVGYESCYTLPHAVVQKDKCPCVPYDSARRVWWGAYTSTSNFVSEKEVSRSVPQSSCT